MLRSAKTGWVSCALPVLAALLACGEGGKNVNQRGVGDQPGGVKLGIGDIAVAPVGDYVLFKRDQELAVGWIESGAIQSLPVVEPTRLAFSKQRPAIYVGSEASNELVAVDVVARTQLWRTPITDARTDALRLESSRDDRFVLAANANRVVAFDAATGAARVDRAIELGVVDVEILPDSQRAVVVEQHAWDGDAPSTRVTIIELESSHARSFSVPNCAADIVVSRDGAHAFLAPTNCAKDPVSVIDLTPGQEHFGRNLPGFGPVAMAPGGITAVAFLDRLDADASLFDDPSLLPDENSKRYHLMLIDSGSLKYDFVEVGDELPRFAVTPDGNVLLVDSSYIVDERLRLLDVPSRTFVDLSGPEVTLDNFVLSSDSRHAYLLQAGLFDVDIPAAEARSISTSFTPANINISADDRHLFLRRNDSEICVFELASGSCRRQFVTVR
jgi:hypothetical protein